MVNGKREWPHSLASQNDLQCTCSSLEHNVQCSGPGPRAYGFIYYLAAITAGMLYDDVKVLVITICDLPFAIWTAILKLTVQLQNEKHYEKGTR